MSWIDPVIRLSNLTVTYPDRDAPAVEALTERVERGEIVAISGPSGCGKTTLCRSLAGIIPEMIPAKVSGTVHVCGQDVRTLPPEQLSARVGLVQQDPDAQVCTLNVWQEVAFGPENLCLPVSEVRDRVARSLEIMGIAHLAARTTTTLSGGEKQRLAIASILAMDPGIVILDEPTANLDPRGAQRLFEVLKGLVQARERTLVVIEHRIEALRSLAPRLLLLDRGKLVKRYASREHLDYAALGLRGMWARTGPAALGPAPRVVAKRVTFGYTAPLLDQFSWALYPGEVVALIGPNGGGKTTLLRLLADLAAPSSGRIVRAPDTRVGFVFQHPHHQIFERTVKREMLLQHPGTEKDALHDLRQAKLAGLENATPLSLSLGEQRRLTMATALSRSPNLLLLDEPFIGQDRWNVLWMIERIRETAARGGAVLVVSHDIPLMAALADRVLYLEGATALSGSPHDVFAALKLRGESAFVPSEEGDG